MDDVAELDDVRARLAELPAEAWTGGAVAAEAAPKPVAERKQAPQPKERKSRLPLLLALLAVAAIVLVVVLASSGGDEDTTASNPPAQTKPKAGKPKPNKPKSSTPAPKPGPSVELTPLSDAHGATGTAALTQGGKRLSIKASGLRDGAYQVWLYDSVIETTSLTKVSGTKLDLDLKLPQNASHYTYVDISREPPDGNPNHSGESVLRVPLAKLSR